MEFKPTYNETDLERFRTHAQAELDKEVAQSLPIPFLRVTVAETAKGLAVKLTAEAFRQRLEDLEVSYPATWWDHLKTALPGRWRQLVERLTGPARFTREVIQADALYPLLAMEGHGTLVVSQSARFHVRIRKE